MTTSISALRGGVCLLAVSLLFTGCAQPAARVAEDRTLSPPELDRLYVAATTPQRRSVRKPVRDAQARAMRDLAAQSERLLAESAAWEERPQLVSLVEPARPGATAADEPAVRDNVREFRNALTGLQQAAAKGDAAAVRREYAAVRARYATLTARVEEPEPAPVIR